MFGSIHSFKMLTGTRWSQSRWCLPLNQIFLWGFGLDNFDPQFTNELVWLTLDDNDTVRKIDGYEFAGFEYINCLSMYEEWV